MKNAVNAEFGLFRRLDLDGAPREIRLITANIDVSFETPFELAISKKRGTMKAYIYKLTCDHSAQHTGRIHRQPLRLPCCIR